MMKAYVTLAFLSLTLIFRGADGAAQATSPAAPVGALGELKSANYVVRLSSAPTQPVRGLDVLAAIVTDAAGKPIEDAQVSFDLNMTNMNHGKNVVAAAPQGKGRYVGQVRFMMPGPWRVIVRVARPGLAPEDLRFEFNVKFF